MNILTFDIEDWFHLLEYDGSSSPSSWYHFESRVESSTDIILDILQSEKKKATFFVLGWVAKKYPDLIKKIHDSGHHIGSHSYYHQLVHRLSPQDFNEDLSRSCDVISEITNTKVDAFRAPGFSITDQTMWAFEILLNNGILYDSSIFSPNRHHGGVREIDINSPVIFEFEGRQLKQFPMSYVNFLTKRIVFSGGGYLRLCPKFILIQLSKLANYNMIYLHPRDFDAQQPRLSDLSKARYFRSYIGLQSTHKKLHDLCKLNGMSIKEYDKMLNWKKLERFIIG